MWLARGNTSRQHREIGLYKVTLDPKLPKYIQILDIFGSAKIQPDVVQPPGSQKITVGDAGAVDRVEFSGGTRADRLHDLVRDRCARCIYNSGRHWEEAEYQQRRPKEDHAALCPRCFYGYRRMTKSGTTYKPTCKKCAEHKKNGRTRRHSSSASASEEVGVAESSQQRNTGTSASTLRPSSGDIISPRPRAEPSRACATGTHVERQGASARSS